jgi:hypothetical protein
MTIEEVDSHIANVETLVSQTRIALIAAPSPSDEADELMNLMHFEDLLLLLLQQRASMRMEQSVVH